MIIRVKSLEDLELYKDQLVDLYIKCFAEAPWHETHKPKETWEWFCKMISSERNVAFVYLDESQSAIAAMFCFPAKDFAIIGNHTPSEIDKDGVLYFSEVFVRKECRKVGIALKLHEETVFIAKESGFSHIIVTTRYDSSMFPILEKLGYSFITEIDVADTKRPVLIKQI